LPQKGAALVITVGALAALIVLLCLGQSVGWEATWRTFDVTPLAPHFFDTHVPIDYAECAAKGVDPYVPRACNAANFNIPPIWLWIGRVAVGKNVIWFSGGMIAAAAATIIMLFRDRPASDGFVALFGILSPSVLMGVERGNPDLLIFAMTGAAALIYSSQRIGRHFWAETLIALALILKLFPMFTVTLALRRNRRDWLFAILISAIAIAYSIAIFKYILLIRSNVPTTFILSYGYKALFLGFDHLRAEANLPPFGFADTWAPVLLTGFMLACASAIAFGNVYSHRVSCQITTNLAGTAFVFGSSIYCGTFLLGTNFDYRLIFLLLCLPQLQDWRRQGSEHSRQVLSWLLLIVLAVLWLNGIADGHTTFLIVPQLFDWALFSSLAAILIWNALENFFSVAGRMRTDQ
jgi:hypothetical protein